MARIAVDACYATVVPVDVSEAVVGGVVDIQCSEMDLTTRTVLVVSPGLVIVLVS